MYMRTPEETFSKVASHAADPHIRELAQGLKQLTSALEYELTQLKNQVADVLQRTRHR